MVRQGSVTEDGRPVRKREHVAGAVLRSAVQESPDVTRSAGIDTAGCSFALTKECPNSKPSRPSNDFTISANSEPPPWMVVPVGRSMQKDRQLEEIEADDGCDTCTSSCRFPDPRRVMAYHSNVADRTASSAEVCGEFFPGATGDETVERVRSRPEASAVTGASNAPDAARGGRVIVQPRASCLRETKGAASSRANRDPSVTVEPRTNWSDEPSHAERSGGLELRVASDADGGLVLDDSQTSLMQPRDRDTGGTCIKDRQHSDASSGADSSRDERFNSSVSTPRLVVQRYLFRGISTLGCHVHAAQPFCSTLVLRHAAKQTAT